MSEHSTSHLVLIPSYNPGPKVLATVRAARAQWAPVWVVVDGSTDGSADAMRRLADEIPRLRVLELATNHGKGAAVRHGALAARTAGFSHLLTMDADGQHPPELIPKMLAAWRGDKAQIVAARKQRRDSDSLSTRIKAHLFNRLMKWFTGLDLANASDFRLLDRAVVDTLLAMPEKVRFFRGMTVWTGFTTTHLDFDVAPRLAGESQWNNAQLMRLAITAISSYSARPLGMIFRFGLFGMLAAGLLSLQAIYSWLTNIAVSGWTSITIVMLFFGSANLLAIGVLGIYIAQIFDEIKRRPEFLISEKTGNASI